MTSLTRQAYSSSRSNREIGGWAGALHGLALYKTALEIWGSTPYKQHESSQCGHELEYSEVEQANLDNASKYQHLYIIASTINIFILNVQA